MFSDVFRGSKGNIGKKGLRMRLSAEYQKNQPIQLSFCQAGIYLLKVNNRNTRTRCDMFKVNKKDTRTASLVSFWCLLLTLNICLIAGRVLFNLFQIKKRTSQNKSTNVFAFQLCDFFLSIVNIPGILTNAFVLILVCLSR